MKIKFTWILSIIFIIVIVLFGAFLINENYTRTSTNLTNDDNKPTISSISPIPSPTSTIIDYNNTLNIPSNDYVINHINWSSYPNLETGYVYLPKSKDLTNILITNLLLTNLTEIKGTDDKH